MIFKNFPIKDFFLKILLLFVVVSSFMTIENYISTKNIVVENNLSLSRSSQDLTSLDLRSLDLRSLDILQKDSSSIKKSIPKTEADAYQLVQKFDARIEEQAHLLSMIEKDNPNLYRQLYKIQLALEKIKIEASKRNIQDLIDHPLISEIEKKLITYKQTLVASN